MMQNVAKVLVQSFKMKFRIGQITNIFNDNLRTEMLHIQLDPTTIRGIFWSWTYICACTQPYQQPYLCQYPALLTAISVQHSTNNNKARSTHLHKSHFVTFLKVAKAWRCKIIRLLDLTQQSKRMPPHCQNSDVIIN